MTRPTIVLVALLGVHQAFAGCLQSSTGSIIATTCPNAALRNVGDCFGATETAWKERHTALTTAFGGACANEFVCWMGLTCSGNQTAMCGVTSTAGISPRLCCATFDRCGKSQITLPSGQTMSRVDYCSKLGDPCAPCPLGQVLCNATASCIDPSKTACSDGPILSKPIANTGNTGEVLRREVIAACNLTDSTLFDPSGQPVAGTADALRTKLATLPYSCACVAQKALTTLQSLAVSTDPFINVLTALTQAKECTLTTQQAQQEISGVRKACLAPFFWSESDNSCMAPKPINSACPQPLVATQDACTLPAARTVGTAKVCSPPLVVNSNGGCSAPPAVNPNARSGKCPTATTTGTSCSADQDCTSPMKCCNGYCASPATPTPPATGVTLPTIPDSTRSCIMLQNMGEVVSTSTDVSVTKLSSMCQTALPQQTVQPVQPRHPCQDYVSRCNNTNDFKSCFANLVSTNTVASNTFCAKWVRENSAAEPCNTYVDDATKCKKDTPAATLECLKANLASLPTQCQQKVQTVLDEMPCDSYFTKYCSSYSTLYDKVNCLRAVIDASADASVVSQTCQNLLSFSAACSWDRVTLCQNAAPNANGIRSCLLAVPAAQLSTSCASLVATIRQNEATISSTTTGKIIAQQSSTDIGCGTSSGLVQNSCTSISGSSAGVSTTTTPTTPTTPTSKVSAANVAAPMYILSLVAVAFAMLM